MSNRGQYESSMLYLPDKPKVLFLSSWYPCRVTPTNGNFIQRHAEAVAQYCPVASLFVIADENVQNGYHTEIATHNHVLTFIIYYPKIKPGVWAPIKKYLAYKNALKMGFSLICEKFGKPDVLHGNVLFPVGWFVRMLAAKHNIPYIFTEHWTLFLPQRRKELKWFQLYMARRVAEKAKHVCPVSYNLQKNMQELGIKANYSVVPNVVDETIFLKKKPAEAQAALRILHISNLQDIHKNISGLLRSLKMLQDENISFTATICGDGNPEPHIQYAAKIALSANIVRIEGEKTLPEVAQLMQEHDVFVLFSRYENLPCVISEAHVCGMPVIASAVGGISEMIDESNGILVQPENERELCEALSRISRMKENYYPEKIRQKAIERYSKTAIGKLYSEIYQSTIKQLGVSTNIHNN